MTARLREQSRGNFLYVQQGLGGIERDLYDLDDLPPGLFGLYSSFFQRHFPDEASCRSAGRVLDVIVATREPLTEEQLARATRLDRRHELARVLRQLRVYLLPQAGPDGIARYTVFHKSLSDWLTDPEQAGDLHSASAEEGHARLADVCWEQYRQDVRTMSSYALAHLPTHLVASARWDDLEARASAGAPGPIVGSQ